MKVMVWVVHCNRHNLLIFLFLAIGVLNMQSQSYEDSPQLVHMVTNTIEKLGLSEEQMNDMQVQIIYTQIERDANNHPRLIHHYYHVEDNQYYYPGVDD